MNSVMVSEPVVKPYVAVERHPKAKVWRGMYHDSRGVVQPIPVSTRRNDLASVETAAKLYCERYHLEYKGVVA